MARLELPSLSQLVPHQGELLLLDRVLKYDDESTSACVVVNRQTWLKDEDGSVACWVALEYMAQCTAAHEGIRAHIEGRQPVRGALASVRGVRFYRSRFEADAVLLVRTRLVRGRPGLGMLSHQCTIHEYGEGQLLVEGRLNISILQPSLLVP